MEGMKMNKIKVMILGIVLLTTMAIPPVVSQTEESNIVVYALPYDFTEYSQFTSQSYANSQWLSAVGAGLYSRSIALDRAYGPELADGQPIISDDALVYTIKLKENLNFSDGNPLTADDVVFTYHALLSPMINFNTYSTYAAYFTNDSIVAVDDQTVEFTFEEPYAFALGLLSAAIQPAAHFQARLDGGDFDWNNPDLSDSISAGPFMVDKFDQTNMEIVVIKNPNYWNAEYVVADKIVFKKIGEKAAATSALSDGEVQILDGQYVAGKNELNGITGISEDFVATPSHQELSFNHLNDYWGTGKNLTVDNKVEGAKNVRKAISHLIDRDFAANDIMEGLALQAATIVPSTSIGWDSALEYRKFDVAKAIEYMEAAGFDYTGMVKDDDGFYTTSLFNVTVMSPNTNPARNQWAALLVQNLPLIGIGVTQHLSTDWATIIPRTFGSDVPPGSFDDGGYDLFFVGYGWDLDVDPFGLYESTSLRPNGGNFYNFENAEYDALIPTYTQELDLDKRIDAFKLVQEFYYEWEIVAPIIYPQEHWAYAEDLQGYDSILLSTTSGNFNAIGSKAAVDAVGGFLPIDITAFFSAFLMLGIAIRFKRKN